MFKKTITCKSNYLVNLTQGECESEPINRMEDIIEADLQCKQRDVSRLLVTSFRNVIVISRDLS